jgi:hypothetical protein
MKGKRARRAPSRRARKFLTIGPVVRTAKIATFEAVDARRLGRVSANQLIAVRQQLAAIVNAA